jgi:hypothetical protein
MKSQAPRRLWKGTSTKSKHMTNMNFDGKLPKVSEIWIPK